MTDLKNQKRMAAEILGIGKNRVWINPNKQSDVSMAITKEDIKELIEEGAIKPKEKKGQSRSRVKTNKRIGQGTRKGSKNARKPQKEKWINKLRAQRKLLKQKRKEGDLSRQTYRKLYKKSKGGEIRDKSHLKSLMEEMEE